MHRSPRGRRSRARDLVPPLLGWGGFAPAYLNLLALCLVALGGEWTVHQIAYVILYGSRFQVVMATTPHRFYMGAAGTAATSGIAVLLTLCAAVVQVHARRRAVLLHLMPERAARLIPDLSSPLPLRLMVRTAILLAVLEAAVFVVQENLEVVAVGVPAPGLAVLVAGQHLFVIPLFAALSCCGSLFLWTLTSYLRHSHLAVSLVEVLAHLYAPSPVVPLTTVPCREVARAKAPWHSTTSPRAPPLTS